MGAKIAGFLATLLLSVPLAAIGLMAVFGIPQLMPANAGPGNEQNNVFRGMKDAFNWGQPQSAATEVQTEYEDAPQFGSPEQSTWGQRSNLNSAAEPVGNRYAMSSTRPAEGSLASAGPSNGRWPSNGPALNENHAPRHWSEIPPMSSSSMNDRVATSPLSGAAATSAPVATASHVQSSGVSHGQPAWESSSSLLSWREASLRLSELGIRNYHLERGSTDGSFLFVCAFSPGDEPHVQHRFEYESDDPLVAVNHVLGQIDRWMRSRFASANYPTRTDSMSLTPGAPLR